MSRYWLSFDLGLRGNYDELYEWLDTMGAVECGDSMATFQTDKSRKEIIDELSQILDPKHARVYIIGESKTGGKKVGKFVLGKRKRSPWFGYGQGISEGVEEEA